MKKILEVQGLTIRIRNQILVAGLDFYLKENETLALVGESGSGKSLTALSMLGLLPPSLQLTADKILFDQTSLIDFSPKQWQHLRGQKIGMVFQEPQSSLNPSMRCGQQVEEVLQQHKPNEKNREKKIIEAFEKVQLPQPKRIYAAYPHELSGGQKQRVMIAMAVICQPKLLICDEPTTALDVTVQKEILTLLQELQTQNKMSVLFISHDLGLVKSFADRVVVMQNGQIVEQGTTQFIFENPQHNYTKGLLHARPPLKGRPRQLITLSDFSKGNIQPELESTSERREKHNVLYQQNPLVHVQGISKTYSSKSFIWQKKKGTTVLNPLDFEIYPGETLGLVGESGSGKSTLARCISLLIQPSSGQVLWEGQPISLATKAARKKLRTNIQYIFQDPFAALHPKMTLDRMLTDVLQQHGHFRAAGQVETLLQQVGLAPEMKTRYPHELSGGQRQRAVIARALAPKPKLIICDEAVAALDISVQAQVLNLLKRLQKELDLAYLFISHDMAVVRYISDRVLVLNQGQKETLQEADALFENPETPYLSKLIDAIL